MAKKKGHTATEAGLFVEQSGQIRLLGGSSARRAIEDGPIECLGMSFENDQKRREYFSEKLREKLKDPEFRKVEGFPLGSDEDILALSDPPYYTACPNPWIGEVIMRPDSRGGGDPYHREPFAVDVKENKHHPIYLAHTYHTKVPHRAIMRYMLHYTSPGDVVLDAFAGTGMTGVAAQLCGDRREVQELGYRVTTDGTILNDDGQPFSKLGPRRAILNDLAPAATFLAHSHNLGTISDNLQDIAASVVDDIHKSLSWMYQTLHLPKDQVLADALNFVNNEDKPALKSRFDSGEINYTIWSEVFVCSHCGKELVFWDVAIDKENGLVRDSFNCGGCNSTLTKRGLDQAFVSKVDSALGIVTRQAKTIPVLINYSFGSKRFEKTPDRVDIALLEKADQGRMASWYPAGRLPEGGETRRNDSAGITHFHHFYQSRSLAVFSLAWAQLPNTHKWIVTGCLHRGSKQHQIAITRIGGEKAGEGGATAGHRRGTLYVPSNQVEVNAITLLKDRADAIVKAMAMLKPTKGVYVTTQSASSLSLPPESLDYFFFDPPFGANIAYSELNSTTEAWLKVSTNNVPEAIEDRGQKKDVYAYQRLMFECFKNVYKALKPGRWMTVEFSNTQAAVWNAIQTSLQEAGFVVANVSALNKGRGGLMSYVGVTAVKQDLIISAYKPNGGLEERFAKRGGTEEGVWDFVRTHMKNLAVIKMRGGELEQIAERDPRILYDQMVAFYVAHSTDVPLSSGEFQAGLAEKFPERDGMYFLPAQVAEYDKKRAQVESMGQIKIFVEDERSAIDWLRNFLKERPSTYQDIQPEFMRQLSASWKKWELRPELNSLLDQNFLSYDGQGEVPSQIHSYLSTQFKDMRKLAKDDAELRSKAKSRWYVPDPKKNIDIETLRNKHLLEEFWTYLPDGYNRPLPSTAQAMLPMPELRPKLPIGKRLKELRTEAIRVGFKHCWQNRDYATIIAVAQRIPETVLQEDPKLLMWYDQARTRTEGV
jgi:hypothetical protein